MQQPVTGPIDRTGTQGTPPHQLGLGWTAARRSRTAPGEVCPNRIPISSARPARCLRMAGKQRSMPITGSGFGPAISAKSRSLSRFGLSIRGRLLPRRLPGFRCCTAIAQQNPRPPAFSRISQAEAEPWRRHPWLARRRGRDRSRGGGGTGFATGEAGRRRRCFACAPSRPGEPNSAVPKPLQPIPVGVRETVSASREAAAPARLNPAGRMPASRMGSGN